VEGLHAVENKSDIPTISYAGKIHLILNNQELTQALGELGSVKELGFDTETRPSFQKGEIYQVALLQLSTATDAYLVRLRGISDFSPIQRIFENKETLKVGLAIGHDLKQLQKIFKFTPQNFIELQTVAKAKGLKAMGLKSLTEEVLQSRLSKRRKLTNWEAKSLTDEQLLYAATDAWIGLHLFQTISAPGFEQKICHISDKL
jgi:ribonuclease D